MDSATKGTQGDSNRSVYSSILGKPNVRVNRPAEAGTVRPG